jgi:hypothetical protein
MNKYTLYLPTHSRKAVEAYAVKISVVYGGCTAVQSTGYWVNDAGALIPDEVTQLFTITDKNIDFVNLIADAAKVEFTQDTVLVTSEPVNKADFR